MNLKQFFGLFKREDKKSTRFLGAASSIINVRMDEKGVIEMHLSGPLEHLLYMLIEIERELKKKSSSEGYIWNRSHSGIALAERREGLLSRLSIMKARTNHEKKKKKED